jgi:Macrophage migration inhibitory factor (MIF)
MGYDLWRHIEPVYVDMFSIGNISNAKSSAESAGFFEKELGLHADRSYISFFDMQGTDMG